MLGRRDAAHGASHHHTVNDPLTSTVDAATGDAFATARELPRHASRVRSHSDNALLLSHMTTSAATTNVVGSHTSHTSRGGRGIDSGGLLLDSDEEEDALLVNSTRTGSGSASGSTPSPMGFGISITTGNGNGNANSGSATMGDASGGSAIPIPSSMASASLIPPRSRLNRREFFLQGNLSPTSSEDEEAELQMYSTSYAGPRDLSNFTFEMAQMTGYLEKQSVKHPSVWKRRWFVMQESVLFYYRSERDAINTKPSDRTCCGTIQLDTIDSVTTAKEHGVGAFQIRLPERKYILRAESKENMHDWLFNFQKSIANIVSVLLRSKTDHRFNRGHSSVTRRSFSRVSRSVSFDYQDPFEFGRMSADFPSHHFQSDLLDPSSFSPDDFSHLSEIPPQQRTSPRRASSPLNFSHYGPRSPVAMFAFDPPFESISDEGRGGMGDLTEGQEGEEEDEDDGWNRSVATVRSPPLFSAFSSSPPPPVHPPSIPPPSSSAVGTTSTITTEAAADTTESPTLQRTLSPPVATGKWVPRYMRDRQSAVSIAPPPSLDIASPPRASPPPPPPSANSSLSWLLRTSRDSYAVCTGESETVLFEDNVSFTGGGEAHGVTSLKGVRKNLEDVCCCVPDLNLHLPAEEYAKHSLYALFDGHCGIRAAKYLDEKLLSYLCEHESFTSNARQAFTDCFKRIDDEFLSRATSELISDGSTAAVVLIRGNKLLTANVGDSRAVVSINGVALDVIEEQTPGRPDERLRIEQLGGWVKEERELQMSKLHSMDLSDPWIQQKAERVVRWVNVYRVNGELAVSRAIGDMDYKGHALTDYEFWAFPEGHDRKFHGDLVVCDPEFKEIEITPEVKFLILACDGLWDTITSQEAVNHVKEKISEGYSTSQISHSLADLAIRSGSSDNVSVIVVILHH